MWDDEDDGERLEYVLGATAHLLSQMGDEQASLLLADVEELTLDRQHRGRMEPDVWIEGATQKALDYVACLEVEPYLQERFTDEVLARIHPILKQVASRTYLPEPEYLETRPALPPIDAKNWRESLHQQYLGDEVTNQARRERLVLDNPVADGLTFTNAHELAAYESLIRLQHASREDRTFAIAPLPGVGIRAGNTWTPDFLLVGNGHAMVLEVDGPQHAKDHRRADDDVRDNQWRRCGVPVRRVPVEYSRPERVQELDAYLREVIGQDLSFSR